MPLPIPTNIATFATDGTGSDYRQLTDQLIYVEAGSRTISAVTAHTHVKTLLGSGYAGPSDIALSNDGLHAYVADSPGVLLRLPLTNLNRAAATVVAAGLNHVDQIALDEAHGVCYAAEFNGGHIQKINLSTGALTPVANVTNPRGVLVTSDGRFVYTCGDDDTMRRFDFSNGTSTVIASGLGAPRHMTWADAGQSVILVPVPNPAGTVLKVDITTTPATVTAITGTTSFAPYSVQVLAPNQLLITCAGAIGEVDLASSLIGAGGPILLGIGFVPADAVHLPGGFADTTMDPGYFFQVKDCPFGGTLPLLVNWQTARAHGASFYRITITPSGGAPVQVTSAFTDYLWSASLSQFVAVTTSPVNGFYPLRSAGQIWLNNWLGALVDSTGQPNGLNTISVTLYSAEVVTAHVGSPSNATLMLDNTQPTAAIEVILQEPGNVPINTCAIVTTGAPTFVFQITASAPAHLQSWSLSAGWGDNQSKAVASDTYANHITASRIWTGISHTIVPPPGPTPWNATVAGDPTSTHCAHSFYLAAWDRVINGWGFVHGPATYQKYITIML